MYKIKLIQENPKVGDIQGNFDLAKSYITEAKEENLDLIIFSEMFLTGYPPEDLLLRDDFLNESERVSKELENLSKDKLPIEKRQLISDFERLISSSFMGQAFKVLIIRSENLSPFLGF